MGGRAELGGVDVGADGDGGGGWLVVDGVAGLGGVEEGSGLLWGWGWSWSWSWSWGHGEVEGGG